MKRVDEARVIKIAESSATSGAPTASTVSVSLGLVQQGQSAGQVIPNPNAATSIFPARPLGAEMTLQQSIPNVGGVNPPQATQAATVVQNPTRVIHTGPGGAGVGGVSVYRSGGDGPSVAITQAPPAAHGTTNITLPPSMHQGQNPVVSRHQAIKPETIALPTTPVSLHTTSAFAHGLSNVKTVVTHSSAPNVVASPHTIVQNFQQHQVTQSQAHQQQILQTKVAHQAVVSSFAPTMRTLSHASLPNFPVVSAAAQQLASAQPPVASIQATPVTLGGAPSVSLSTPASNANAAANAAGSANFQRLKVEDALSYLDQVKFKFGNQPQVYNDFLDIMKEFKSQSIDTPGVIARVSCLFKGHPALIVGFNTFLPPGYKIEMTQCNADGTSVNIPGGHAPNTPLLPGQSMQTIVHTPQGIHTMGSGGLIASNLTPQLTAAGGASIRPVTPLNQSQPPLQLPASNSSNSAGMQAVANALHNNKFQPIKSEGSSAVPPLPQLPQQPAPAHFAPGNAGNLFAASRGANDLIGNSHHLSNSSAPAGAGVHPGIHPNNNIAGTAAVANSQPVEFNHAINYVNKIKNRFQGQPEVYKQFLEILHTYQKDQKAIKEGHPPSGKFLTESEVYAQVSKLFQNQDDLLNEFGQFLPEATGESGGGLLSSTAKGSKKMNFKGAYGPGPQGGNVGMGGKFNSAAKRPSGGVQHQPPKKAKLGVLRDVSLAEAGKFGTLNEYAFFDKVRKAVRSPDAYDNFLRCLSLYNQEIINRQELSLLSGNFLSKSPELYRWFKDFIGIKDGTQSAGPNSTNLDHSLPSQNLPNRERMTGDSAMEIDYATCKRLGASYCAVPKNFTQPRCVGRTALCREVLNDTWVSFPSWSEDSQFVTSRKTQFEEFIYRTEDERFEFDVVLETNRDTIKVLECVQKKMSRMPPEEAARHRLDDCLGGTSATIHQRAIRRIYGDKAGDIIDGLKHNPVIAVPLVIRRLKAKDEEWREVQKNFNKIWRDQNEKYYLKSLDHQGLNFKQSDVRNIRSKSMLNEIEVLFDERHENEENSDAPPVVGPHLTLEFRQDAKILRDANNLLIHHVKRQSGIHKDEKHKCKLLLKHFLMDMFKQNRQEMSDDEKEEDDEEEKEEEESDKEASSNGSKSTRAERARKKKDESKKEAATGKKKDKEAEVEVKTEVKEEPKSPGYSRERDTDETYKVMMCNNNWYFFIRLHHILCKRLALVYDQAVLIASEEAKAKKDRKESTATALRLKPKNEFEPEDYYPAFLDLVKNVLDGHMDNQTFEDTLREMFGIHAYHSYTLDKVVNNAVRQLQHLVSDEGAVECHEIFLAETKNFATGGACATAPERQNVELLYQKRAEKALEDENCFKISVYHQKQQITIELLDSESDSQNSDQDQDAARNFNSYVERFTELGDDLSSECKSHLAKRPCFLPRCVRTYTRSKFAKRKMVTQSNVLIKVNEGLTRPAVVPKFKKKEDLEKEAAEAKSKEDDDKAKEAAKRLLGVDSGDNGGIMNEDNLNCKFDPKTMKIVYVLDSESVFFRKNALRRAKESHKKVCLRKHGDLNRWHENWVSENVTEEQKSSAADWFMGRCEGLVPNQTTKVVKNWQEKTPYRTFHKYRAELIQTGPSAAKSVAPTAGPASANPSSESGKTGASST